MPNSSAFAQQTMRSVQFVLDWKKTLTASLAIGFLFFCMGFGTLLMSWNASQIRIIYDGPRSEIDARSSGSPSARCPLG